MQGVERVVVQFKTDCSDAWNVDFAYLILNTDVPDVEVKGEAAYVVNGKKGILHCLVDS